MSAQRQKGTAYETYLLPILARVWPNVERAAQSGVNDFGDFTNVGGWLLEAKKQETWTLPAWIRTVQKKVRDLDPTAPWAILFAKDKRSGIPDMVALPTETWIGQLERNEAYLRQIESLQSRQKEMLDEVFTADRLYADRDRALEEAKLAIKSNEELNVALERQLEAAAHTAQKKLNEQKKKYEARLERAEKKRLRDLDKRTAAMAQEYDEAEKANEALQNSLDTVIRVNKRLQEDLDGANRGVLSLQSQLRKARSR